VEEHGNEDNSGESVSELSQPGCQDALDFQKKITPRRDSEQALSLNARGPSRLISGMVCKLCCVAYSFLLHTYSHVYGLCCVMFAEIEEDDQLFNLALEARLHAVETIKQSQQELIVVASLVDRIPNLAGLTRTCEVLPCQLPLCGCLFLLRSVGWLVNSGVLAWLAGIQSSWLGCCRQEHSSGQAVPTDQVRLVSLIVCCPNPHQPPYLLPPCAGCCKL
jgi:hypothetical protein